MRKFLKLLLWLFAGVGIVLLTLVALLFLVDVNHFRPQIERQVANTLGRDVTLEGPLTLEPSLTPRFAVAGLRIANPDWASRPFLAHVEKFDVRVALLPLLDKRLEIVALEFHGVDLLLELTEDGKNNFTFAEPAAGPVPQIEHLSLHQARVAYAVPGLPSRTLYLQQAGARVIPGEPLELEAQAVFGDVPLKLSLQAESQDKGTDQGGWKTRLVAELGDLSLRLDGRVGSPGNWDHGSYQVHVAGPDLDDLERLSGLDLPDTEPYEVDARVGFDLDDYLKVDEVVASIGNSDLRGSLDWDIDAPVPALKLRLASQRLDIHDMGLDQPSPEPGAAAGEEGLDLRQVLDQKLDPTLFDAVHLDVQVEVGQLEGLTEPVNDIAVALYAQGSEIRLGPVTATLADKRFAADIRLPWGGRVADLVPGDLTVGDLLGHAEAEFEVVGGEPRLLYAETVLDRPLELKLSSLKGVVQPGAPMTVDAQGALNDQALALKLTSDPLGELVKRPEGPWDSLVLEVRGEGVRLDVGGSIARPLQGEGMDIRYALSADELYRLVPLRGSFALSGRYRDLPAGHRIDELALRLGGSDIGGRIELQEAAGRSLLNARLNSKRLRLQDLQPAGPTQTGAGFDAERPLIDDLPDLPDLDIELRAALFEGLEKPLRDIRLTARGAGRHLELAPIRLTVDDLQIDARASLPWGDRLSGLARQGLSTARLVEHTDLELGMDPARGRLRHQGELLGEQLVLDLDRLEAVARAGEPVAVKARIVGLGESPVSVHLGSEPLADLLRRPEGPWRELSLAFRVGDVDVEASGSVERPLEGSGFDIRYKIKGAEIDRLLPLFDLILPMEGAYSISGRLVDRPDQIVMEDLKLRASRSDIGGKLTIVHAGERPRVDAELYSEQIYLRELLPADDAELPAQKRSHVIPDYTLPTENMLGVDGEIVFRGKRLRTDAGDLGDIKFRASLEDGVFRLAPFRVRGWAGALVEGDVSIDASQQPPAVAMEWTARDLNYGLMLQQAGVAEIVEGLLDVTFRLSGRGQTRRELLADADGELIIVGQDGRIGSRLLDLWGADLLTTMLSPRWHAENVTQVNCVVARVDIKDGVATSDKLLLDTRRITVGASGALDLDSEELNFVLAPSPKRASLVSLTNPVHVTGTLASPNVSVAILPRRRTAAAGTGVLAGLLNPAYLIFVWSQTGWGDPNPCLTAVDEARVAKGWEEPVVTQPEQDPPEDYTPLRGCSRMLRP